MSVDRNSDSELDDLLRIGYAELLQPRPDQRRAVLDALTDGRLASKRLSRPGRIRWQRWTLVAACLVALLAAWSWRTTSHDSFAYGIEDVPQRLAEVQSFRLRGWQSIRWENAQKQPQPPIRVLMEIVVERPGKFRRTLLGMSCQQGQKPRISQSVMMCDGKHLWTVDADNKLVHSRRVSRLDALLSTETIAQNAARLAVLGPPDAHYRKIGREEQNGRWCDLYEGRFSSEWGAISVARVWIDPKNGLPVRVVRSQVDANGTLSPEIELTEIAINVPLPEELFRFQGPEDPKLAAGQTEPPVLFVAPTAGGSKGNDGEEVRCDVWHALRISDAAALVIWRRSAPTAKGDEAPDWLSGITMLALGPQGKRELRHHWVYQSNSPDRWSWSLVVPADGKPLGQAEIFFRLRAPRSLTSVGVTPLSFRENDLRELLRAAQGLMLPRNSAEVSLPYLQAVARKVAPDSSPRE